MTRENMRLVQRGLQGLGHDPGSIDGLWGKKTAAALSTLLAMAGQSIRPPTPDHTTDLPWMAEAKRVLARHEVRDNGWLRACGLLRGCRR